MNNYLTIWQLSITKFQLSIVVVAFTTVAVFVTISISITVSIAIAAALSAVQQECHVLETPLVVHTL